MHHFKHDPNNGRPVYAIPSRPAPLTYAMRFAKLASLRGRSSRHFKKGGGGGSYCIFQKPSPRIIGFTAPQAARLTHAASTRSLLSMARADSFDHTLGTIPEHWETSCNSYHEQDEHPSECKMNADTSECLENEKYCIYFHSKKKDKLSGTTNHHQCGESSIHQGHLVLP